MTANIPIGFALLLFVIGCASSGHKKHSAVHETSTREAVALQTTQTGVEGSDINIDDLLDTATLSPYPKKGELEGFRVDSVKPKSPWTKAGFRQGDIIIRVGDQPIQTRDDLMVVFYALGAKANLEIELLRKEHGKQKNVIFEIGP